jgi:hypothetical protein
MKPSKNFHRHVRFEVFTAVSANMIVFWDVCDVQKKRATSIFRIGKQMSNYRERQFSSLCDILNPYGYDYKNYCFL